MHAHAKSYGSEGAGITTYIGRFRKPGRGKCHLNWVMKCVEAYLVEQRERDAAV